MLTEEQRMDLEMYYMNAKDVDSGLSQRTGEHMLLMAVLSRLGHLVMSIEEAYRVAERLLYGDPG